MNKNIETEINESEKRKNGTNINNPYINSLKITKSLTRDEALNQRKWLIVDATGIPLGRLASEIAGLIRGKHKPNFTPNTDCGDFVIVINASKVVLTGKKMTQKVYYHHSGYPGGMKARIAGDVLKKSPEKVITSAVEGMLIGGPLGHALCKKLKVYKDDAHHNSAQMPEHYKIKYFNVTNSN